MPQKQYDLFSELSSKQTQQILLDLNGKSSFLDFIVGKKLFTGIIKDNKIDVDSFDSPPIKIVGEIIDNANGSVIKLRATYDTNKNSVKGYILTTLYCIAFVLLLSYINHFGLTLWILPIIFILLITPLIFFKIYWFFNGYDPDPDYIIKKIKRKITLHNTV